MVEKAQGRSMWSRMIDDKCGHIWQNLGWFANKPLIVRQICYRCNSLREVDDPTWMPEE